MDHTPMSGAVREAVLQDLLDTRQTIYIGIAGFTILIWDHMVTFAPEVELIWKAPKSTLSYLFLLNRYLTPLGFIVNLVAYNLPTWSNSSCKHFVRYEGAMTAIGIEIVGLMMLIRVRAMYKYQRPAIALAVILLLVWIGVTAWLLSNGQPVIHSDSIHSCTMIFDSGSLASATAWLPLIYDTYVFGLTFYRTFPSIRNEAAGNVVRTLFADGLLFYSLICTVNLVLSIMIVKAPAGEKNIAAQVELLLTVTMMSRITLNLKKQGHYWPSPGNSQMESFIQPIRNDTSRGVATIGRMRSRSASSALPLGTRVRSGSASSTAHLTRSVVFAQNPSTPIPHLSPISSVMNTPVISQISSSPVSDRVSWLPNERNTANVV